MPWVTDMVVVYNNDAVVSFINVNLNNHDDETEEVEQWDIYVCAEEGRDKRWGIFIDVVTIGDD